MKAHLCFSQIEGILEANSSVNNTSLKTLDFDWSAILDCLQHYIMLRKLSRPEIITHILIGFLGVTINLLCMMALFQVRDKWTSHFRIMLSLMFADLLTAASYITWVIFFAFSYGFPKYFTYLWQSQKVSFNFVLMGLNAVLLNLICMAVDHYVTIMYPWHSPVSKKKCCIAIITMWLIAALTGFSDSFIPFQAYEARYTTFLMGIICIIVMASLYISVYRIAKNYGRKVAVSKMYGRTSFINHKNLKALVTTAMILGTFILFWLPIGCINFIMVLDYTLYDRIYHLYDIFMCIFLLNTICDPIIYAIQIRVIRKGFLILLSKIASKCLKHKFTDPNLVSIIGSMILTDDLKVSVQF